MVGVHLAMIYALFAVLCSRYVSTLDGSVTGPSTLGHDARCKRVVETHPETGDDNHLL